MHDGGVGRWCDACRAFVDGGGGRIAIATLEGSATYVVQALDGATVIESRVYRRLRACD